MADTPDQPDHDESTAEHEGIVDQQDAVLEEMEEAGADEEE